MRHRFILLSFTFSSLVLIGYVILLELAITGFILSFGSFHHSLSEVLQYFVFVPYSLRIFHVISIMICAAVMVKSTYNTRRVALVLFSAHLLIALIAMFIAINPIIAHAKSFFIKDSQLYADEIVP